MHGNAELWMERVRNRSTNPICLNRILSRYKMSIVSRSNHTVVHTEVTITSFALIQNLPC